MKASGLAGVSFPTEQVPVPNLESYVSSRCPKRVSSSEMSQEQLAVAIAKDVSGAKKLRGRKAQEIYDSFHKSIARLVYKIAWRYALTCHEAPDDLAQDCFYQIMRKIGQFKPRKSKLTTWTQIVCSNMLNRKYRQAQRLHGVIVNVHPNPNTDPEDEDFYENLPAHPGRQSKDCPGVLAHEMAEAIRHLAEKHPKQRRLLFEMVGNPYKRDFTMPTRVMVSEAARSVGMEYGRAYAFYCRIVRPYFKQRFE